MEYAKQQSFYLEKDRIDPELKFTHCDVVKFIRDFLKEFRPLSDMLISDIYKYIFRVKQIKEGDGTASQKSPRSPKSEEKKEETLKTEGNEEVKQKPLSKNSDDNSLIDEQDNDEKYKTPEEIKKRFLFRCV
jgi:hypothetical protein